MTYLSSLNHTYISLFGRDDIFNSVVLSKSSQPFAYVTLSTCKVMITFTKKTLKVFKAHLKGDRDNDVIVANSCWDI